MQLATLAVMLLLNPFSSLAAGDMHFGMSGGWDSAVGDVYKLHLIGDKGDIDFGIGGLLINNIADDAAAETCGGGGFSACEADGTLLTVNAFGRTDNIYYGVGYSRMNFPVEVGVGGANADGDWSMSTVDFYGGVISDPSKKLLLDLRLGYRYGLNSEYDITSTAGSFSMNVSGDDWPNLLKGVYVSLHAGFVF